MFLIKGIDFGLIVNGDSSDHGIDSCVWFSLFSRSFSILAESFASSFLKPSFGNVSISSMFFLRIS